mgnify:FL=1
MGYAQRTQSDDPVNLCGRRIMKNTGSDSISSDRACTRTLPSTKTGEKTRRERPRFLFLTVGQGAGLLARDVEICLRQAGIPFCTPVDRCCVRNFQDELRPRIITIPAGKGREFRSDMKRFVKDANRRLRQCLSDRRLREKTETLHRRYKEREQTAVRPFNGRGLSSPAIGLDREDSVRQGHAGKLAFHPAASPGISKTVERDPAYADRVRPIDFPDACARVRELKIRCSEELESRVQKAAQRAIAPLVARLRKKYRGFPRILVYLEDVQEDILKNLTSFTLPASADEASDTAKASAHICCERIFSPYSVAVLADGSAKKAPPVVFARDPDLEELMGCFSVDERGGSRVFDASFVKGGLIHEADGGCLVVSASWIIRNMHLWELLKKTVLEQELAITASVTRTGIFFTGNMISEEAPLQVTVLITGSLGEYALLSIVDRKFRSLVAGPWNHEGLSGVKPGGESPGETSMTIPSGSFHPSARTVVLQLCTAPEITDDRREEHLSGLLSAVRKARTYAGSGHITAEHIFLAVRDVYPALSTFPETGITRKRTMQTERNRHKDEQENRDRTHHIPLMER